MNSQKIAQRLNAMQDDKALASLRMCCASTAWCEAMLVQRPFADDTEVADRAAATWWSLDQSAWLEAFAAHPLIGDIASLRAKFASTANWATHEQSGVAHVSDEVLHEFAEYNRRYCEKFGYIFIICATGKSADEMLAKLRSRLPNSPDEELRIAATEQLKITLLRLEKLAL